MIDRFPYGKAPFWLGVLALGSLFLVLATRGAGHESRPDLVFALFAPNHVAAYRAVTPEFEREHGVRVAVQLVHQRALRNRLQNAMLAGTQVPDLIELLDGSMGVFTRGPLTDVGFLDLTDGIEREGYRERLVESRLSLWSSRSRVFALPHDVHPVMLMYRADLVEALGIDVTQLRTWEDFSAAGRRVVRDLDGDGVVDRYMIDLPAGGNWGLTILLLQRGIGLFDSSGRTSFNQPKTIDTMIWYLKQTLGASRIAYECGWGQSLNKAMTDGLALFYFAPDWRTYLTRDEVPKLRGKLKLMPLPAWELGGRRTSVWGGTGLAISRATKDHDLAWQYAKFLYFNKRELGKRFSLTHIIPPFEDAWDLPEFRAPNPFFSGQQLGRLFAALAPETPPVWSNAYSGLVQGKIDETFLRAVGHYRSHGESGLRELIQRQLDLAEAYVHRAMNRNVLGKD